MPPRVKGDTKSLRLSRLISASIWSLRLLLGGRRGENLIHRLGLSDLRSFYYFALVRLSRSYRGPIKIVKGTTSYYEFGVGRGNTLSRYLEALKVFCRDEHLDLHDQKIFLFDSFQGLPEKRGMEDDHPDWAEGLFAHTEDEIKRLIRDQGVDPDSNQVRIVKGFFEQTLTSELREDFAKTPPDIVTIDVDYYSSTRTVLEWLEPILSSGTLFYFDDIWSFNGSPTRGELGAINEFNKKGKGLLVPFNIVPALPNQCYIYTRD